MRVENETGLEKITGIGDIAGKWKLVDSKKFDDYLKEVGIGWVKRKAAKMYKPSLAISASEGNQHWVVASYSAIKDHRVEFYLGKEFSYETVDGRKMKSTITAEGDKLVQLESKIMPRDKDSRIVHYVGSDGKLHIELESGGVHAEKIYEREA